MIERTSGPSWLLPKVKRIGVAHAQGDRIALVIADQAGGGGDASGAAPRIILAESFPATATPDIRAALTRNHVRHLIRIAPAARTIARSVQVPAAPVPELLTALELMAEAQLANAPEPHRRGWAVLPLPAPRDAVSGVVLGWLGEAPDPILDATVAPTHESWTSELVALALLIPGEGAAAACVDRSAGSIGVATCAPTLRLRSMREDPARFDDAIRSVRETIGGNGSDAVTATDAGYSVILSRAVVDRLREFGAEASHPSWLARFALAAGVATAALDEARFLSIRPALSLRAQAPPRQMPPVERAMRWVAVPRHATGVIAAGLVIALFAPWGLASARHAILSSRLDATKQGGADTKILQKQGDFMDELSRRRWPMTKLLGDLAGSMPVGVQVESITITPGDRVAIKGIADTSEKLSEFITKLNATTVFEGAKADSRERVAEGYAFDINTARVVRPAAEAKGLEDYAAQSLGVRLYGADYKEVEAAEAAKQKEADAKRADSRAGSGRRGDVFNAPSAREQDKDPIPDPLSTEKIAKLDRAEAGKEMSLRSKVASRAGIDPEVKKRLKAEVDALRARLAELKGEGK